MGKTQDTGLPTDYRQIQETKSSHEYRAACRVGSVVMSGAMSS